MTSPCFASLRTAAIRIALLDPTTLGPLVGSANGYVSTSQIQVQVGATITTGDSGEQKNGDGAICAAFQDPDRLKDVQLTTELCDNDPQLKAMMTGGNILHNAGAVSGMQAPSTSGTLNVPVCFEVWTRAWDGSAQALPSMTSPNIAYWHWVFPCTYWTIDNFNLTNAIHTFPLKGRGSENTAITANGPFNDWPAGVRGITRCFGYGLDGTLPTATCAAIAVPSGS